MGELVRHQRVVEASEGGRTEDGALILKNSGATGNATIVLDYGKCTGGVPVFDISAAQAQGPIAIQVVYSETIEGIGCQTGDGPFFLFSNAMDTYRSLTIAVNPSTVPQRIEAIHAQRSQRYQKLVLLSADTCVTIREIGFMPIRPLIEPNAAFECSDEALNRIWQDGVRTLDMCTVTKGEIAPAWHVTKDGTRVFGQHWAPCRQGTRWGDKSVSFRVLAERHGASWGVHTVANGVIFCLNTEAGTLEAFEGLAHQSSIFPVKSLGSWPIGDSVQAGQWATVDTVATGDHLTVKINNDELASVTGLQLRPILGGPVNTGSVAFGGPEGWVASYRDLVVRDPKGSLLYENDMLLHNQERVYEDFQVGPNFVACTIDGAKRDRACFGGDLFVSGRGIAYSGLDMDAVAGSIELLTSHQTSDGYLGNLCPIQAPLHRESWEPPSYAFYSLTYACLLVVAVKDYWLYSGDRELVDRCLGALRRFLTYAETHSNDAGFIEVPPELSMHWYPMGGPVFGASGTTNLAYLNALQAVWELSDQQSEKDMLFAKSAKLQENLVNHFWNPETNLFRMSTQLPVEGFCQDTNGYALSQGIIPMTDGCAAKLTTPKNSLPLSFNGLSHWDHSKVVSPYATGFAAEGLFKSKMGAEAIELVRAVWGPMADPSSDNYSGGHWEAMSHDGKPFGHDTSLMHAWSTWPVFLLPQYVVGVKVMEPGWRKIRIEPLPCGIESAAYRIETPGGEIDVRLKLDSVEGSGSLAVTLPAGVQAEIVAPQGYIIVGPGILHGPTTESRVTLCPVDSSEGSSSPSGEHVAKPSSTTAPPESRGNGPRGLVSWMRRAFLRAWRVLRGR